MNVIITDGDFKHTLAAIRSLGEKEIKTTILSHRFYSPSFFSRHCYRHIPSPDTRDLKFSPFLIDLVKRAHYDVVIPVSDAAVKRCSESRDELLKYTKILLPSVESLTIASDKFETAKFAGSIGVVTPKIYSIGEIPEYPAVVKGRADSGHVRYVNSDKEMDIALKNIPNPMIQEYIKGEGYGFFALYGNGKIKAQFMHKRLREYPITGGPSSLAIGIYDEKLREEGTRILDALKWNGPAMVEFKKDISGRYVLMEINPKLWGSMDLSISSGINFPYLIYKLAMEGDIEPVMTYKTGIKFRWLFPQDILCLISKPSIIKQFLKDFADDTILYDICLDDILPFGSQVVMTVGEIIKRIFENRLEYPDGLPR